MTHEQQQIAALRAARVKAVLDAGFITGVGLFLFGLYLIKPFLAPLVGGLLIAVGCGFAGYDMHRRTSPDGDRG